MITILTPAYNRGHLLGKLYQSLVKQDFEDFEWVIVDDGSSDSTTNIVDKFIQDEKIIISYIKQSNGGKHRALNRGVIESNGELILIVDSDDSLPKNSLSVINRYYLEIKDNPLIGGVCGLMAHHDGTIIGKRNALSPMDISSIEMRYKYAFTGDVCEVFKAEVLRDFPFPEIENEKFCPEDLVLNRIAKKFKLLFINDVIYYRDYLDGGLTSKIVKIRMQSPIASMMCYAELLQNDIPYIYKLKAAINYWRFRFCYHGKGSFPKIRGIWNVASLIGWGMHIKDVYLLDK
ncbi:glycosyltransferase family A protein [Prevotella jejuni]